MPTKLQLKFRGHFYYIVLAFCLWAGKLSHPTASASSTHCIRRISQSEPIICRPYSYACNAAPDNSASKTSLVLFFFSSASINININGNTSVHRVAYKKSGEFVSTNRIKLTRDNNDIIIQNIYSLYITRR